MRNQRFLIALIILTFILAIPTTIIAIFESRPKDIESEIFKPVINFYQDIEFEINVDDISHNEYIDTIINLKDSEIDNVISLEFKLDEVGSKEGKLTYDRDGIVYEDHFTYSVVDNIAPLIHQNSTFVTQLFGTVDYNEYLSVTDNSLREGETLEVNVNDENLDTSIPGNHYVTVSTEDASGNRAEYVALVIVYGN